jgi:hypothetical protein
MQHKIIKKKKKKPNTAKFRTATQQGKLWPEMCWGRIEIDLMVLW